MFVANIFLDRFQGVIPQSKAKMTGGGAPWRRSGRDHGEPCVRACNRKKGICEKHAKSTEEKAGPFCVRRRPRPGSQTPEKDGAEMQDLRQGSLPQLFLLSLVPSSGEPPFGGDGGRARRVRPCPVTAFSGPGCRRGLGPGTFPVERKKGNAPLLNAVHHKAFSQQRVQQPSQKPGCPGVLHHVPHQEPMIEAHREAILPAQPQKTRFAHTSTAHQARSGVSVSLGSIPATGTAMRIRCLRR